MCLFLAVSVYPFPIYLYNKLCDVRRTINYEAGTGTLPQSHLKASLGLIPMNCHMKFGI